MAKVRIGRAVKKEVKEGLTTSRYSFRLTPTGGVQTSKKTGRKITYRWGKDGILRPYEPAPSKCRLSKARNMRFVD